METEIWKAHPECAGIEVSTLGGVRTLDRVTSSEDRTWFTKGRILKQHDNGKGYLMVNIPVDEKWINKSVHRLVAQTFIKNTDNLPQVNHKDCDRMNNNVSNLEWCTASYNNQYREKYGISRAESLGHPVFAINLDTMEVSRFRSQGEAGRALGVDYSNITKVIKGKYKQANGYWFTEDDGNGIEIDKDKLNDIMDGVRFRQGVFAINLTTLEVSQFRSQAEAGRNLGVYQSSINKVIKGTQKTAHGYWFTNDDGHAVDVVKSKLHDIGKTGLNI